MRILTVRLNWIYSSGDEKAMELQKRRDALSNLGMDVTKISDDEMSSGTILGMSDTQFIELSIGGEKDMSIIASNIIEPPLD